MTYAEPVGGRVTYGYDGDGKRVRRASRATATVYVWDADRLRAIWDWK